MPTDNKGSRHPKIDGFRFNIDSAKGKSWDEFHAMYKDSAYTQHKPEDRLKKLKTAFEIINAPEKKPAKPGDNK